jgi:hypothetical protein
MTVVSITDDDEEDIKGKNKLSGEKPPSKTKRIDTT